MPISRIESNSIAPSQTLTTPIIATTMGVGGATPSGSGSGITFPATQSASTDANTLDDYEEGTWTPTFNKSGSSPTVSYAYQYGYYRKIGSVVFVTGSISVTSQSGGSGGSYLGGLPFVPVNGNRTAGMLNHSGGITYAVGTTAPYIYCADATSGIYVETDGGSGTSSQGVTFGSSFIIYSFGLTYFTS